MKTLEKILMSQVKKRFLKWEKTRTQIIKKMINWTSSKLKTYLKNLYKMKS